MADLETIRTRLIKDSGRHDLVGVSGGEPDYSDDNGADWYINEGIRELDGLLPSPTNERYYSTSIVAGDKSVAVASLRIPKVVFVTNSDGERYSLTYKTERAMREYYEKPYADVDQGEPSFFSIAYIENSSTPSSSMTLNIMPPADGDYDVEVYGTFYSSELSDNSDVNWWTLHHPGLVVMAARYAMEVALRNTAGQNDWLNVIARRLEAIDFDQAERDSIDMTEIQG